MLDQIEILQIATDTKNLENDDHWRDLKGTR